LRSILVSHPHAAAVANATASTFERHGRLALYVTGVAAVPSTIRGRVLDRYARREPVWRNRLVDGVAPRRLRSLIGAEVGARLVARAAIALGRRTPSTYDAVFIAHDRATAAIPWPRQADGVYVYEDCARATFEKAIRRSMRTVLDVPAPYYGALADRWRAEWRRFPSAMDTPPPIEPEWKRRRKDTELRASDLVSVASAHTRSSLEGAPIRGAVVVTPYGFPTELFSPKTAPPDGPFTVLAVGAQTLRKGTHCLLMAWKRAGLRDARLKLIGPLRLGQRFLDEHAGLFEHVEHLPRREIAAEYQRADLVAFPTLGDGFGLVIQEAMCSATPVVTTPSCGGPECITDGQDGWIVPAGDIDALVENIRFCHANRDRVRQVGLAARARAERSTWRASGDALVGALDAHLG
jgi:glycosyltransferase involved in cell wall biosynthesis